MKTEEEYEKFLDVCLTEAESLGITPEQIGEALAIACDAPLLAGDKCWSKEFRQEMADDQSRAKALLFRLPHGKRLYLIEKSWASLKEFPTDKFSL